jgi:serine/threonine protein kinase
MIAPASRKIGKYEILHKLGRGGMADVYLAQDTELNYRVALKLIEHAPDPDTQDSIDAERRGATLQAHLAAADPHVVRIYDAGDADGFFYVAMEYVDGQDLSELLRRGPLVPEFAVDVARAVAQTLDSAHNLQVAIDGKDYHGIVHGDIKPKNIRVDTAGEVRVLDFGIAKALSLSRRLTRNEFGSVPYGSPERLELGEVNVLSDLWSLAVMLYEMLAGAQPFQADSTERLERTIRSRVPPTPPESWPEPLRRILLKALAPEPELRYQTAKELDEDLAAFREGGTVRAVAEDLEATRRTPRHDPDETRRSHAGVISVPDDETRRTGSAPKAEIHFGKWPPKRRLSLVRKVFAGAALLMALWMAGMLIAGILLYKRGQALARQIDSEQITDPNQIWTRWTELSGSNSSSPWLSAPRKAVTQKLVSAADRIIESYRNGDVVYETSWKNGQDLLAHALTLSPDAQTRGRLRICEGHLARIAGTSHKSASDYNDAVAKFAEAEELIPRSPDPYLGLARVYVYGLKDIDKAYQALQEAEKRGYQLGNREKSQLADGYRDRADRLFWDSRNVRGMPQEKDEIQRAKSDYERALELYQEVAPWGNANASIARVQQSLESVNSRLDQIAHGTDGPLDVLKKAKEIPAWLKPLIDRITK